MNKLTQTAVGFTHVGQIRRVNEDALLINDQLKLYAIADGMGGHGAGDVASQLACEVLEKSFAADGVADELSTPSVSNERAQELLKQCINKVNEQIFSVNEKNAHASGTGMGTTLVGICLIGEPTSSNTSTQENGSQRAIIFHVGDSRCYEHIDKALIQLTDDHTMYRDWEENGCLGPAPPRNIIMRAVGLFNDVDIDSAPISLKPNARYLLCSDGLSDMLSDELIESQMTQHSDNATLARSLIERANANGGKDNVTVIVLTPHSTQF